ncbi:hypothetical protein EVAR_101692_1 [Eumeta japonica]|uniref:Uncharacterized protein n=1 Tax=Eumeta variegata TaxID=151549 RepID=A0A4C1SJ01_EUMVA|nr:hypothetical protein EVAR_101692_1 [Eumeta japonica]
MRNFINLLELASELVTTAKHTYWGSRLIIPGSNIVQPNCTGLGRHLDHKNSRCYRFWCHKEHLQRELVDVEASLDLSSDHSPTIVSIRIPQRYELPSHI